MKNLALALLLSATLSLQACADPMTIGGVTYDTYGVFNESEKKSPDVEYHLCVGNVVWGLILSESVVFPIYFFGFSLYEPIGRRNDSTKAAP